MLNKLNKSQIWEQEQLCKSNRYLVIICLSILLPLFCLIKIKKMDTEKVVVIKEKMSKLDLMERLSRTYPHTGGAFIKNPKRKENK